jgi:hypothetical protein
MRIPVTLLALMLAGLPAASPVQAQGVNINVNVGAPPPPVVLASPPPLVIVRGSRVMYAPGVDFNLFVFEGRYYSFHNGAWFYTTSHGSPWMVVAVDRVPQAVRAVPVTYYKIPPGQAKKMMKHAEKNEKQGGGPGHGKGKGK